MAAVVGTAAATHAQEASDASDAVTVFVFADDESTGNRPVATNLPDWAPQDLRFFFDAREALEAVETFRRELRSAIDRRRTVFADTRGRAEVRLEIVATRHEPPPGQRRVDGPVRLVRLSLRDYGYTTDFLWGKVGTVEGNEIRVNEYQAPEEVARWLEENVDQLR